jgi:type I restriction enzyme S subunit
MPRRTLANARELFESYLNATLNTTGNGWIVKQLGQVCDLFQGLAINKGTKHLLVENSNLPLLRIKDLRDGTEEQYVAEVGFPKNAEIFPKDIIYTRTGQIGLVFRGRRGVLHNNSFKVVPRTELDRGYLFWWLQEPSFRQRIVGLASRAAQPDITHSLFKVQEIQLPPMSYQNEAVNKIERLYSDSEGLQATYQQKLDSLAELKQSILQKAFAGELIAQPEKGLQEAAAA